MTYIDCHVHVSKGLEHYDAQVAGMHVIFNSVAEYRAQRPLLPSGAVASLIMDLSEQDYVTAEVLSGRAVGLKIHSRLQQLTPAHYPQLQDWLARLPNVPVVYDAFYFGTELAHQPSLDQLVALALAHPQRPFVVAHAGGYRMLEYFFHLRPLANIYFDFSFSLQYLADTHLRMAMLKLLRYTPASRLMWGSDYPFAQPALQQQVMEELLAECGLTAEACEQVTMGTARSLYGL